MIIIFHLNYNILIDSKFCTQISTFQSIWHFALRFQHFDQFLLFHSNCIILHRFEFLHSIYILFDLTLKFALNFHHFDYLLIPNFVLEFKHLDSKIDSYFFTQIATFWLNLYHSDMIFSLKFQHFISFWIQISTLLSSNFNILIDSYFFTQFASFWSISYFALKLQYFDWSTFSHFDQFDILHF